MNTTITRKQHDRMMASARNNGVRARQVIDEKGCMCAIGHVISAKRGRRLSEKATSVLPAREWAGWIRRYIGVDAAVENLFGANDSYVQSLPPERKLALQNGDRKEVRAWAVNLYANGALVIK